MKRPLLAKPSLATRSAIARSAAPKAIAAAIFLTQILSACSIAQPQEKQAEIPSTPTSTQTLAQRRLPAPTTKNNPQDAAFEVRSLALREKLANQDLDELDDWWRRKNIGDPHKYLLPVILSRLSLGEPYSRQHSWDILMGLEREQSDLYHFRSIFDIRTFFLFRNQLPANVEASYRRMVETPHIFEWLETGTENHMLMQRMSGLALIDGSGWPSGDPATAATLEAWLRSELNKFLTIGQGEFHSSTYYGYAIAGLLNLYDFAQTPELKQLAKATLDWYAANMALRLSWGTAGGAESRGFDRSTWNSGLSAVAWLWWGDVEQRGRGVEGQISPSPTLPAISQMEVSQARVALPAALSTYRPPAQLRAIARKEIPLPFQARASHPSYYSYHQSNRMWETFYVTQDYSLGTLLEPQRSYQVKGTINAQYATYKLVVRDRNGQNNAVISLGGTFHSPMATGRSPGDQYLQERGAVLYQLRLNEQDKAAGVPAESRLVLPARYGQPQRHKAWYIWRIENTWLCARPWGNQINWQNSLSDQNQDWQALVASGTHTAWITEVARIANYPDFPRLAAALDNTTVDDRDWNGKGRLGYTSLLRDRLILTYAPNGGIGRGSINGKPQILKDWPVLESPYLRQGLNSGVLEILTPGKNWRLRATLNGPQWEENLR